jgi:hypothetical protein
LSVGQRACRLPNRFGEFGNRAIVSAPSSMNRRGSASARNRMPTMGDPARTSEGRTAPARPHAKAPAVQAYAFTVILRKKNDARTIQPATKRFPETCVFQIAIIPTNIDSEACAGFLNHTFQMSVSP